MRIDSQWFDIFPICHCSSGRWALSTHDHVHKRYFLFLVWTLRPELAEQNSVFDWKWLFPVNSIRLTKATCPWIWQSECLLRRKHQEIATKRKQTHAIRESFAMKIRMKAHIERHVFAISLQLLWRRWHYLLSFTFSICSMQIDRNISLLTRYMLPPHHKT